MQVKVTFLRLDGDLFSKGGNIQLQFRTKTDKIITTNFAAIQRLQKDLSLEFGTAFTNFFEEIQADTLDAIGGALLEMFFEDSLNKQGFFISSSYKKFFHNPTGQNVQTIEPSPRDLGMKSELLISSSTQSKPLLMRDPPSQPKPQPILLKKQNQQTSIFIDDDDDLDALEEMSAGEFQRQYQQLNPSISKGEVLMANIKKEDLMMNEDNKPDSLIATQHHGNRSNFSIRTKFIHSPQYTRRKVKQMLRDLFKARKLIINQELSKVFNCSKCSKAMSIGIKCHKCLQPLESYCEACNTNCRNCGVLMRHTDHHSNIRRLNNMLLREIATCKACGLNVQLINIMQHLRKCEENEIQCRHCQGKFHFTEIEHHKKQLCSKRPVSCQTCTARFPINRQRKHSCFRKIQSLHAEAKRALEQTKQLTEDKLVPLEMKLQKLKTFFKLK